MIKNLNKTKEIVFRRPSIRHLLAPAPVSGIEQVMCAKLLGVIFQQNLSFDDQVDVVLRTCSQRVYLLKLLRDQGIPQHNMDIVFHAMVLSKIRYALCVWGGHITADQKNRLNALLRRVYKYRFISDTYDIDSMLSDIDTKLFKKMRNGYHCINFLLPSNKSSVYDLRERMHDYELPTWQSNIFRNSFVVRCLYRFK